MHTRGCLRFLLLAQNSVTESCSFGAMLLILYQLFEFKSTSSNVAVGGVGECIFDFADILGRKSVLNLCLFARKNVAISVYSLEKMC